jgi:small GTP-binding protein
MRVVLVGDTQVGKTCILNRLTSGIFRENSSATVGAGFQTHVLSTPTGHVTMQIWDTAGQEKYRALAPMYYRSAKVAILCFDVTNANSFHALESWAGELSAKGSEELHTIVAGNKADLADQRAVPRRAGQEFSEKVGAAVYIECSAKTGIGVIEVFTRAALLLESPPEDDPAVVTPKPLKAPEGRSACC